MTIVDGGLEEFPVLEGDPEPSKEEIDAALKKALAAAEIDVELEVARERDVPPAEAFSREHLERLRQAKCTKAEARSYLESVFGRQRVRRDGKLLYAVDLLEDDLDSYGEWEEA